MSRDKPIAHWQSQLTINIVTDDIPFSRYAIPADIYKFIRYVAAVCFDPTEPDEL